MTVEQIRQRLEESARAMRQLEALAPVVGEAAEMMTAALRGGGKVLFCGNGGSAADSQHLAAELVGRFLRERAALAALALTVDTSALTAIGNDYGFEQVFARQVDGVGRGGDVLVALSTSGESANVLLAVQAARRRGIGVIALTGEDGGALAAAADVVIRAPARRVDLIQEMHIVIGHALCACVESAMEGE